MAGLAPEPIAIIGSACRFPGGATNSSKLWSLLSQPRDVLSEIPPERFNAKSFYHQNGEHHGTSNVTKSYFLSENIRYFDTAMFSINPREAESMDPQQRLLLETVYEALEASGLTIEGMQGSQTSVYVGQMTNEYHDLQLRDTETLATYTATGTTRSILSNRVSYFFDWKGPSMTIDTACSSSLVAVHQAVQSLRCGESTVAVAAGANLILGPEMYIIESKLHMLSPSGRSRMWDSRADGYGRGEGFAAVMLKTLSAALRDGDQIECIIRETGVNQDGRTTGITMPSATSQVALIQDTYRRAGLDLTKRADRPQFFEAHGTGTPAGDPIEAEAVSTAFFGEKTAPEGFTDQDTLFVGSIKTLIGHLEGAAGLAGLLKASLALKHHTVPPNMHLQSLNPKLTQFKKYLKVPTSAQPWPVVPGSTVRRASVNSFGFGGTNAHAILESYDESSVGSVSNGVVREILATPIVFSANTEQSLLATVKSFVKHLKENPSISLPDLSWTLQARRTAFAFKKSFPAATIEGLISSMEESILKAEETSSTALGHQSHQNTKGDSPRILGIFTGQGAQWPAMGRELMASDVFSKTIQLLENSLCKLPDGPSWSLRRELCAVDAESRLNEAEISQPLCTAVQIALVDLLTTAGVSFHAVIGHSSGEIAAAYAAGMISATDSIRIAYYRGIHARLAQGAAGQAGSMMAAGLSFEDAHILCVEPQFASRLAVAASNAPSTVTLSGDKDAIQEMKAYLDERKIFTRILVVDKAYHSHHMIPCSEPYIKSLRACNIRIYESKKTMWISSVHGHQKGGKAFELSTVSDVYWSDNMTNPVLFSQAVTKAVEQHGPFHIAIEVGPHPALKGPATQTIKSTGSSSVPYHGLLKRGKSDKEAFSLGLGFIWEQLGPTSINLDQYTRALLPRAPKLITSLPAYQWDHNQAYWKESRISRNFRMRSQPIHPLLGTRCPDDTEAGDIRWRNILKLDEIPWLRGHKFQDQILFPGAGHVALAFEASKMLSAGREVRLIELEDFEVGKAITLKEDGEGVEILFTLKKTSCLSEIGSSEVTADFSCYVCHNEAKGVMDKCSQGRMRISLGKPDVGILPSRPTAKAGMVPVNTDDFYQAMHSIGLDYTGMFRTIDSITRSGLSASADTVKPEYDGTYSESLMLHPAMLDVCFQTIIASFCFPDDGSFWTPYLPTSIRRIRLNPTLCQSRQEPKITVKAQIVNQSSRHIEGDFEAYNASGNLEIQLEGLVCTSFSKATPANDQLLFSETVWDIEISSSAAKYSSETETDDERDLAIIEAGERVAYYYLRTLREKFSSEEVKSFEWWFQRLFEFADHVLPTVASGEHYSLKKEWADDSYEYIRTIVQRFPGQIDIMLVVAVGENLPTYVRGKSPLLEVMVKDNMLTRMYQEGVGMQFANAALARMAKQIAHRHPKMKVLEVGAGTGGMTKKVLEEMDGAFGSFTFTDISTGFFEKSRELLQSVAGSGKIIFKALDVEKDPEEQGYVPGSYDLIIASNVLHATRKLDETLTNVRKLLRPGGYLLLHEVTGELLRARFIFSGLPGWWLGSDDGRRHAPTITPVQWDDKLRTAGFSGVDIVKQDFAGKSKHSLSIILSQAMDEMVEFLREPLLSPYMAPDVDELYIVGGKTLPTKLLTREIAGQLRAWTSDCITLGDINALPKQAKSSGYTVLCLEDLDAPVMEQMTPEKLQSLQRLFGSAEHVLYVTRGIRVNNPYSAAMIGLGRTILFENPELKLQFIDVATLADANAKNIAEALLRLVSHKFLDPMYFWTLEPEVAYENKNLIIPRVVFNKFLNDKFNSSRRSIKMSTSMDEWQLVLERDEQCNFVVRQRETCKSLGSVRAGQPIIRVDFSLANSLLIAGGSYLHLGLGTNQDSGERVIALLDKCASTLAIPSDRILSLGGTQSLSDPEIIVSIAELLVSATLLEAVPRGGTILIHEPNKRFARTLLPLAAEKKLVVILTTTKSEYHKSQPWVQFHPYESRHSISKRLPKVVNLMVDFSAGGQLAYNILSCMPSLCIIRPVSTIFQETALVTGSLTSCEPRQQLELACLRLANASNGSKPAPAVPAAEVEAADYNIKDPFFVIDWTSNEPLSITVEPTITRNLFSANKTYILFGLTGQVGLSLTAYMIDNGARHIVLTSRNPKVEPAWIEEQRLRGAEVKVCANDITLKSDVQALVGKVRASMPPIGGVANAAMVLHDKLFVDMDLETWETAVKPKIDGSRFLDEIFRDPSLEFFVMFSSMASLIGNGGQSNYNAGNMYCCGLAEKRRKEGLPASVFDIGKIVGIGYVARTGRNLLGLSPHKFQPTSERKFLQMFAESVISGRPSSGRRPILSTGLARRQGLSGDDTMPPSWLENPRLSHTEWETDLSDGDGAISTATKLSTKQQLEGARTVAEAADILGDLFAVRLAVILQMSANKIPKNTSLIDIGIDSLIAVEVRSWFMKEMNVDMPVLKVLGGDSVTELCRDAVARTPWAIDWSEATGREQEKPEVVVNVVAGHSEPTVLEADAQGSDKASSAGKSVWIVVNSSPSRPDVLSLTSTQTSRSNSRLRSQPDITKLPPTVIIRSGVLSHSQESLWLGKVYAEDPTTYNVGFSWSLRGSLQVSKLQSALEAVARKHEILRTRFQVNRDTREPCQDIQETANILFECRDFVEEADVRSEFTRLHAHEFDLESAQTMKVVILKVSSTHYYFMLCYHHIILDGVSLRTFLYDLNRAYSSEASFLRPVNQYLDYTLKQKALIQGGILGSDIDYWKGIFKDFPAPLPLLPLARVKSRISSTQHDTFTLHAWVGTDKVARVKEASRQLNSTTFHFYSAVLEVLLFRLLDGATEDLCIGIADANRLDDQHLETLGFFLNLLPVRFKVQNEDQFSDVVKRSRSSIYGALGHSKVPFDILLNELNIPRSSHHSPLFQVLLNYTLGLRNQASLAGCQMEMVDVEDASTALDLVVTIVETPGQDTSISLTMQKSLYLEEDCSRLMSSFMHLLDSLSTNPAIRVVDTSLYPFSSIDKAISLGRGPRLEFSAWEDTLSRQVDRMVRQYPGNLAVKIGLSDECLTYRQLEDLSKRIAQTLIDSRVKSRDRVAVFCEPGVNLVASLLAIGRVGATYVPLDMRNPVERLARIVSDARPSIILCENSTAGAATSLGQDIADLIINISSISTSSRPFENNLSVAESPAFILYTSGSTGEPKGIVLRHNSWLNQIASITTQYELGQESVLQQSSYGFDVSIEQIFTALANGGTLVIAPKEIRGDAIELSKLMSKEKITFTLGVPSEYSVMLRYGFDFLKQVKSWKYCFCGGENTTDSLRQEFARLELPGMQLINVYGPTEVTLSCCRGLIPISADLSNNQEFCPVGKALPNYSIYIVDKNDSLLPVGFPGEIVIGGAGIASGYLERDALTKAKFVADRYTSGQDVKKAWNVMYRSGDRGRMLDDGSVVFLGRIDGDSQIKLRGQRIELEEIENLILREAKGNLTNVAVSARGIPDTFLLAFAVFSEAFCNLGINKEDYLKQLRQRLPLPQYMCPAVIIPLDNLPLGVTGKSDRRAIDAIAITPQIERTQAGLNDGERCLRSIWLQVLPEDALNVFDIDGESDFFAVGGNSLLLVKLQAAIQTELGSKLSLFEMIQASTLGAMAQRISSTPALVAPIDWVEETRVPKLDFQTTEDSSCVPVGSGIVVVLTGATGFLGASILQELVASASVTEVHCIAVRQQDSSPPRRLSIASNKITLHYGDLALPRLGLSQSSFAELSSRASVIVHNGADVHFLKSYLSLKKPNVQSTSELIRLSGPRRIPIHYISTGGVAHLIDHRTGPLSEVSVASYLPPTVGAHGYVSTKWASERMLERASDSYGIKIVIHRPTGIIGNDAPSTDIMGSVLRYSMLTKAVPVMDGWSGHFDFVRVEDVAKEVVSTAVDQGHEKAMVKIVHNCNDEKIPVGELKLYLERNGDGFSELGMEAWTERARQVGLGEMVAKYLVEVTAAKVAWFPTIVKSAKQVQMV